VSLWNIAAVTSGTSPELITGGREQWSPDEIGEALRASVLGV
jgi:hypothetical protein